MQLPSFHMGFSLGPGTLLQPQVPGEPPEERGLVAVRPVFPSCVAGFPLTVTSLLCRCRNGIRGLHSLPDGAVSFLHFCVSSLGTWCLFPWKDLRGLERESHLPSVRLVRVGWGPSWAPPLVRPSELPAGHSGPPAPGLTLAGVLGPRRTCSPVRTTCVAATEIAWHVAHGRSSRCRPRGLCCDPGKEGRVTCP